MSGFERRRISSLRLKLELSDLQRIVNKRLQLVTGISDFHLGRLYPENEIMTWLQAVGGSSPRVWLDQVYPLINHYLARGLDRMLTQMEWDTLRKEHPPQFFYFPDRRQLFVGGQEKSLDIVPPNVLNMLAYLWDHSNLIISREELYFLGFKSGLQSIPKPGDNDYESPQDYRGSLDTAVWRLRHAIEPDPKFPVLIESKRGHGFLLHVRF